MTVSTTLHQLARRQAADENEQRLITGYIPKLELAIIGAAAFGVLAVCAWTQFTRIKRQRYMLTLCIGLSTMSLGYILRIPFRNSPGSVALYSVTTLFVLLSPCAFLALEYMLLGRLAVYLGPETVAKRCMVFRARFIAKFFVTSDVVTFLVQGAGGGISASPDPDAANLGHKIALVGVILQAVAFGTFTIFLIYFGMRVKSLYPEKWNVKRQYNRVSLLDIFSKQAVDDWRILYWAMLLAAIGFIVRSIFRAVEFSQGYDGYLVTTESYFYLLDALPIFLSCCVFVALYPPRFMMRQELFADGQAPFQQVELKHSGTRSV